MVKIDSEIISAPSLYTPLLIHIYVHDTHAHVMRFHSPDYMNIQRFLFDDLAAPLYISYINCQTVGKYDLPCSIATAHYPLFFSVDKRYDRRVQFVVLGSTID